MSVYFILRPWENGAYQPGVGTIRKKVPAIPVIITSAGAGGGGYTHDQPTAEAVWTVNHNLGRYPAVQILSPGGVKVRASILHTSLNQFTVTFKQPYAGQAIAR